jgi:beta-lactamase superfamily II metal-dependent hydrolase
MRLHMLPAGRGDALVVEWGDRYRMLVDGGPRDTYPALHAYIKALPTKFRRLDVLVVTHIDNDHIEGLARMLLDRRALGLKIKNVWFNGFFQLPKPRRDDGLGPTEAEYVGALLTRNHIDWNRGFACPPEGELSWPCSDDDRIVPPVVLDPRQALPRVRLPGGAVATLISPGPAHLKALRRRSNWLAVLDRIGMRPGEVDAALCHLATRRGLAGLGKDTLGGQATRPDSSVANASSIAFLLEHQGSSLLLTGDGHGRVLSAGLRTLLSERGEDRLNVGAVKVPHHGSAANVTDEFLSLIDSHRFLFSTDGSTYRHPHPHQAAVERVLNSRNPDSPVDLVFNYRVRTTQRWAEPPEGWKDKYTAIYPERDGVGITVEV